MDKKSDLIEATVALPMFNSKYIGWLPLESLIRQKNINFNWELIIIEEQNGMEFGEKNVMRYKNKLYENGCKRIKYIPIKEWIHLSLKWINIAKYVDKNSKVFMCQAADNFSHPFRLFESYDYIVNKDYDYICYPYVVFYCIPTNEIYKRGFYDGVKKGRPFKGYQYSFKTEDAKSLPRVLKKSSIDKWLFETIPKISRRKRKKFKYTYIDSDYWEYGFNTHGFHNLTLTRYKVFKNENPSDNKEYFTKWPKKVIYTLQQLKDDSKL